MSYKSLGEGVYQDSRTGHFYERPTIRGRRTFRKLHARTLKLARELIAAHRTDAARADAGLGRSPYAPKVLPVGELVALYKAAGCPDLSANKRTGKQLYLEEKRIEQLLPFWKNLASDSLTAADCHRYAARRRASIKQGNGGGRAVDLELTTLGNVLRWAVAHGKLDTHPLGKRPRFRTKTVAHCRDYMPRDADDLHALATALFETRQSEVLGWQLLLEAFTGCRTSEILRLRWDAAPNQAGFIEGEHLWLERSKGGCNPFASIHPALKQCLDALRIWRDKRRPKSPWFLPGYRNDGREPVDVGALTHALRRIAKLISGEHRTSHGLRAYYVTVRRSQGISDGQIAAEIGDASGAAIIASTYGNIPPNWQGRPGLTWMPPGAPAWEVIGYKEK